MKKPEISQSNFDQMVEKLVDDLIRNMEKSDERLDQKNPDIKLPVEPIKPEDMHRDLEKDTRESLSKRFTVVPDK